MVKAFYRSLSGEDDDSRMMSPVVSHSPGVSSRLPTPFSHRSVVKVHFELSTV